MEEVSNEYDIKYGSKPPYEVLTTRWLSYDDILKLKQVEVYYNSFQFPATMALMEICRGDAFAMYEDLGRYYEKKGYFGMKHSRISHYEILWDYVKNPPSFVRQRDKDYLG